MSQPAAIKVSESRNLATQDKRLIRAWFQQTADGWNRFWFTPADAATLAMIRICTGLMLFYTHLVWSLRFEAFFGPQAWLSPEIVRTQSSGYTWSHFFWIQSPALLWTIHIAALVIFMLLALGLWTRVVSILSLLLALSYVHRIAPGADFGLDQINILLAGYLIVGRAGDAFSLDRWLKARKQTEPLPAAPSVATNIAIRLIQLHMCIIYLFAGMAKLQGGAWWVGTAMWYALANYEYQSVDMTWMAKWPRLINIMTHLTIFWEVFYCALIWPRALRPVMLILAIPLHLGIAIYLGMATFGLIMLVGNMAFVSPNFVRLFAGQVSRLVIGKK